MQLTAVFSRPWTARHWVALSFVLASLGCAAQTALQTLAQTAAPALVPVTTLAGAAQKSTAALKVDPSGSAAKPAEARVGDGKPLWTDLTNDQRVALAPLSALWAGLGKDRKLKWIAVSKGYPLLSQLEKEKLMGRMTEWASLSPQQRQLARHNFVLTQKLTPAEKTTTWEAYQALSDQEKQRLAAVAITQPVGGTAPGKLVAPQKLAQVPLTRLLVKPSGQPTPLAPASAVPGTASPPAADRTPLPSGNPTSPTGARALEPDAGSGTAAVPASAAKN